MVSPTAALQEFELDEREIQMTTINDEERSAVMAKIAERKAAHPRKHSSSGTTSGGSSRRPSPASSSGTSSASGSGTDGSRPDVPTLSTLGSSTGSKSHDRASSSQPHQPPAISFDNSATSGSLSKNSAANLNSKLKARSVSAKATLSSSSGSIAPSAHYPASLSAPPASSTSVRRPKSAGGLLGSSSKISTEPSSRPKPSHRPKSFILGGSGDFSWMSRPSQQPQDPTRLAPPAQSSSSSKISSSVVPQQQVTAWEEELDRVANNSKKQSEDVWAAASIPVSTTSKLRALLDRNRDRTSAPSSFLAPPSSRR